MGSGLRSGLTVMLLASALVVIGGMKPVALSVAAAQVTTPTDADTGALRPISDPSVDPAGTLQDAMTFAAANDATAGPFALSVDQRPGHLESQDGNVQVQDFIATFTYLTPPAEPAGDVSIGIDFWSQQEGGEVASYVLYLLIRGWSVHWALGQIPRHSDSIWMQRGALPAGSVDLTPGAQNELTVVVSHGYAMLTGNTGQLATTIQIPGTPQTGDVFLDLGFQADDPQTAETLPMAAQNFRVWDLTAAQVPAHDETAGGEVAPTAGTAATTMSHSMLDLIFAHERAAALTQPPLDGPIAGEMRQTYSNPLDAIYSANRVQNFYATATFVNPADMSKPSDIGIAFRDRSGNKGFRFVLASNGFWWLTYGNSSTALDGGNVWNVDAAPGASNTIELIASGTTGLVAVNGVALAQLDLSSNMLGDKIFLFTGEYNEERVEGRTVLVQNFEIYPLPT